MNIRTRKLLGSIALVTLVVIYALVIMVVGSRVLQEIDGWRLWAFYAVAGTGWLVAAMPLVRWMQRPDPENA